MQRCLGCMQLFGKEYDVCPYCGYFVGTPAVSRNHLEPGTVLQRRYTLGRVLGQGGFGVTYIAWDHKLERPVAIKEYLPHAFASRMTGTKRVTCFNEEAQRQFLHGLQKTRRETKALSRFDALESVVKVYDCVEENGTAYIIMELLRGKTVKEIVDQRGKLTFVQTMRIMTPVLETLDAMHKAGMIHRDVAPDNIFVCKDHKIKLLDFGAARVISDADEKTLSVMLKAGYAPIEQYSSKVRQGAYTDVYAASATLYKMLTGETPPDSLSREMDGDEPDLLRNTDAPQSAQREILRGMAQNPDKRTQSAEKLLQGLQQAIRKKERKQSAGALKRATAYLRVLILRFGAWGRNAIQKMHIFCQPKVQHKKRVALVLVMISVVLSVVAWIAHSRRTPDMEDVSLLVSETQTAPSSLLSQSSKTTTTVSENRTVFRKRAIISISVDGFLAIVVLGTVAVLHKKQAAFEQEEDDLYEKTFEEGYHGPVNDPDASQDSTSGNIEESEKYTVVSLDEKDYEDRE
ncbi:MAG: serine/threonine protein kinase [Clostridia bacterium]|nr:serine/threonine protein kinase [Clostridia bacterium]